MESVAADRITVVTQDAVLATFDDILGALTLAVGGIAAISLAVAGILIMNVMLVAVSERRAEIGLLLALGATPGQILTLILAEASLLSLLGSTLGLALGQAGALAISKMLRERGQHISVVGIPKTIDNDLPVTDNCPGFGSVAKYVAVSTIEASLDVASMASSSTRSASRRSGSRSTSCCARSGTRISTCPRAR